MELLLFLSQVNKGDTRRTSCSNHMEWHLRTHAAHLVKMSVLWPKIKTEIEGLGTPDQHDHLWLIESWINPMWLADWLTESASWLKAATLFRISFSLPRNGISDTLPWRASGSTRLTRVCWSPSWGHTSPSYWHTGGGTNNILTIEWVWTATVSEKVYLKAEESGEPFLHFWLGVTAEIPGK